MCCEYMLNFEQFSSFLIKFQSLRTHFKLSNTQRSFISRNRLVSMSNHSNLKPPDSVGGLTKLNKELFKKNVNLPVINISHVKLSSIIPSLKKYLLKIENFKPVRHLNDTGDTEIYLNPDIIRTFDDLGASDRAILGDFSISEENFTLKSIQLSYDNYTADDILKCVLPQDKEGVSSFTKIGHIVHVNLREHLIPYKNLIGEILFDKVAGCRTVVNKVDGIENTYRNFRMEVLKGDDDFVTQIKENKCIFEFDFSKVYWNSRLCTEHERIVNMLHTGDVLFDVFAGVGPFAIPAAKKRCKVFANDLNPESFKWLNHNSSKNKVNKEFFQSFNEDGRDFILNEVKDNLLHFSTQSQIYITMNLPALAVEFLDAFVGLYDSHQLSVEHLTYPPIVIVYCFAKGGNPEEIAKQLLIKAIGCCLEDRILSITKVRTVSSMKEMMRIMFKLDKDILTLKPNNKRKNNELEIGQNKRCTTDGKIDSYF